MRVLHGMVIANFSMKKSLCCGQCLAPLLEMYYSRMHGTENSNSQLKCLLSVLCFFRFFLELMVKSMIEHLGSGQKLDLPRKQRFPERFLEDIVRLVGLITTEILVRQHRDGKESKVFEHFYLKT